MDEKIDLDDDDPLKKEIAKGMKRFGDKESKKSQLDLSNPPKNLDEVYKRLGKWLYITDFNRIDVVLAVILSNQAKNSKPLWIFIVGASGDSKSELLMAIDKYDNVMILDRITANSFASGSTDKGKRAKDIGAELHHASTIILFPDLACLKSINPNEKNEIWGQLRELYDGRINKRTGNINATKIQYGKCHVTMIACTTPDIKAEYTVHNQLGTREFSYDTFPEDIDKKMKKALDHLGKEAEMKKSLKETIQGFLSTRTFNNNIEWNEKILNWTIEKCKELMIFRATAQFERQTGELRNIVEKEVPTRLIQQFALLYKSLKSLDDNYPDEKYREIIKNIVKSSGDPVRQRVYHFFKKRSDMEFNVQDVHGELNLGRKTIKKQCEVLTAIRYLVREIRTETYGAHDQLEHDVTYYRWKNRDYFNKELSQSSIKNQEE